jgi:flagellin
MRINTNVSSMQAMNANNQNNVNLNQSLEKLSSGLNINKASDDASGLAIADKLRTQASALSQAVRNGNAAITYTQIADQAMAEQSNILDIIKTKLVQAATGTTTSSGLDAINADIKKLAQQIGNIASKTNYNGFYLLQATSTSTLGATERNFQMGEVSGDVITLGETGVTGSNSGGIRANLMGMFSAQTIGTTEASALENLSIGTNAAASALLDDIDTALTNLNTMRSNVGSTQNRIESSVRNLNVTVTNLKAAESIIRDVDYAAESANFNKLNIISQAGTYAISQANNVQQNVMKLLQ